MIDRLPLAAPEREGSRTSSSSRWWAGMAFGPSARFSDEVGLWWVPALRFGPIDPGAVVVESANSITHPQQLLAD